MGSLVLYRRVGNSNSRAGKAVLLSVHPGANVGVWMISKEQPVSITTHIVTISALVGVTVLASLPLVAAVRARRAEHDVRREWDAFELGLHVARQIAA